MESYLMMLYVTLEQETSLKNFFTDQGWAFSKPDLSVTTDQLGPAKVTVPNLDRDSGSATSIAGKRKAQGVPKSAPKVKLIKVLTGTLCAEINSENVLNRNNEIQEKDRNETTSQDTEQLNIQAAVHYDDEKEDERNSNIMIKVENINYNIEEVGEEYTESAQNEDVGDEENEDTDTDDGMEDIYTEAEEKKVEPEFEWKPKTKVNKKTTDEDSDKSHNADGSETELRGSKTVFTCEICGRRYQSKPTLQRHLKKHSCPFYCRSCSMAFYNADDLEHHNREKHNKQYSCPKCDKYFKRKNSLAVHMESVHMGVHRFPCTWPDCEKSFFRQDVLKDHINTHTGERPHTCQKCKKSYTSKSSLNHHWKACKTNGLPCHICGQVLSSRSGLADHIQGMHKKKPLTCVCGQVFTWRNNLLKHKKNCSVFYSGNEMDNML